MAEEVLWEDTRYSRQVAVPLFGESGQKVIADSSIAVIGAGGVKSTLLLQLAALGVGHIRVIDFDRVELSNLNRQLLYDTSDIGQLKAIAAAGRLRRLNPEIDVQPVVERATHANLDELTAGCSLVLEGGDGGSNRLEFNRWAVTRGRRYIHASAQYNYAYVVTVNPGSSACFECIFDDLPASHIGPVPVLGTATSVAGAIAAGEAVNSLLGHPQLAGTLLFFDGWTVEPRLIPVERKPDCPACGLQDVSSGGSADMARLRHQPGSGAAVP